MSDYSSDNDIPLANKKVPCLKDENNDAIMIEFVELKTKIYVLYLEGKKNTKKAKSIKSNSVAKSIMFEDYTRCLNDAIEMMNAQAVVHKIQIARGAHDIRSKNRSKSVRR